MIDHAPQDVHFAMCTTSRQGTVTIPSLPLDNGETLIDVVVAFESWGTLSPVADNAILLCHALTGSAHAYDPAAPDDPRVGWWNPLIGPGRPFDTDRYCVICTNVVGGCYGSTGPASPHPVDGEPYRLRFPLIAIGDMVRAQRLCLEAIGVSRLAAVAGGSLGGLQALEWAVAYPDAVALALIIAAAPRLSAQGLAIDDIARQAIMADPAWNGGDYALGAGPTVGLRLARMLAMLTYTTAPALDARFGRRAATHESNLPQFGPRRDIETYMHHQGEKLVDRFDANAYLYLTQAMDAYDVALGPDRGSDVAAFERIRAAVVTVGIDSDWLYPAAQVRALAESIAAVGGNAQYAEIHSLNGHDAFLQEWKQLERIVRDALVAQPPHATLGER